MGRQLVVVDDVGVLAQILRRPQEQKHCRSCIRGILCYECNVLVGFVEHKRHRDALAYIEGERPLA